MASLEPARQGAFVALGHQRWFTTGETLIHEGQADRSVFLLLSGRVKVVSTDTAGHPVLLAVRLEGDVVGELAALDEEPRSATVVAASRVAARLIGPSAFRAHLAADVEAAAAVHRSVVGKLREATRIRSDLGSATVVARLATILVQLGERHGVEVSQGRLLDLQLSQADLAALIGAGEKSVHRALALLRERGFVLTGGQRQLLLRNLDGLARFAREA